MSELDRALDAEMDRFRPGAPPAFAGLRRRARRRRQGRLAGGSVLAVGMVAAVAVLVPGRVGGTDRVVAVAVGSATPTVTVAAGQLSEIAAGFQDHSTPTGIALDYRPTMQRCAPADTITQLLPNNPALVGSKRAVIGYAVTLPRDDRQRYARIFTCLETASGLAFISGGDVDRPPPKFSYDVGQIKGPPGDPALEREVRTCLSLAGQVGVKLSNPPIYGTTLVGQLEALAFTRCLGALPNVRITQTSTTAAPPSAGASGCLYTGAKPASEYVGLPEAVATVRDVPGPPVRVDGRDGVCLAPRKGLRVAGIDLVVERGTVVAAVREG